MPFHNNIRVSIIREQWIDDVYGGAVSTGIALYFDEPSRIDYTMPRQNLTGPYGLETTKTYSFFFHYNQQHPIKLQENDLITITFPPHHPDYLKDFKAIGVSYESTHPSDPRGLLEVTTHRIEKSRGKDF